MSAPAYDRIGLSYSGVRRADPRFEAAIWSALGDARSVLNVGAGAGSYEPLDRDVIAVEPSAVMIAQRPSSAAPAIQGVAESLPLQDKSVDATMGVFTMQHWDDVELGLAEVLRVTRERIVFLTLEPDVTAGMWLCRDYLPEIVEHDREAFPTIAYLQAALSGVRVEALPVPNDCADGFCVALWSRPEMHLDPRRAQGLIHLACACAGDRGQRPGAPAPGPGERRVGPPLRTPAGAGHVGRGPAPGHRRALMAHHPDSGAATGLSWSLSAGLQARCARLGSSSRSAQGDRKDDQDHRGDRDEDREKLQSDETLAAW